MALTHFLPEDSYYHGILAATAFWDLELPFLISEESQKQMELTIGKDSDIDDTLEAQ